MHRQRTKNPTGNPCIRRTATLRALLRALLALITIHRVAWCTHRLPCCRCHGLEPSRVQIRPNGRNIQVDIDELWLDDLSPRESMAAKAFLSIQQVLLRGKTGQLSVAYCEAHNAARDCALTVLRPRICRRSPSCRGGPSKTVRYSPAVPLHRSCCRSFVTSRG